jgi:hypothetical protein
MTLEDAKAITPGDSLMSPHTAAPFEPVRVTDVQQSASGRFVYVRCHGLSSVTAMAGGWCDARAFAFAPAGYKYNHSRHRYEKLNKDKQVVAAIALPELRDRWAREIAEGVHLVP